MTTDTERCHYCYTELDADNRAGDEWPNHCADCIRCCYYCGTAWPPDHRVVPMDGATTRIATVRPDGTTGYRWESQTYCHNCVSYCDGCDEYYVYPHSHIIRCECGNRTCCDNGYYCDESEESYCDSYCHENYCSPCQHGGEHVHDWNYKPHMWKPKGDYPRDALMGIELEICGEPRDIVSAVHSVDSDESHLYLMRDGSVSHGLEIVSHPATLSWLKGWDGYRPLLSRLREHGCHGDDYRDGWGDSSEHGLHIHVSRNAFRGVRHRMAWLMLFYAMRDEVEVIARRDGSRWARWTRNPYRDGSLADMARGVTANDRYVAINGNNDRTYEVRVFKSTVDPRELFACIELIDATVRYSESLTSQRIIAGNAQWLPFITWAAKQSDEYGPIRYGNLIAFATNEGMV